MGIFSQPLNRSGSSVRPATPQVSTGIYDNDDVLLLAPVKGSESFSFRCSKTNKYPLTQRLWNIIQSPKGSSSATMSNLQKMSGLESDTDRSMSPVEEWENDNVNLLPQRKYTSVMSITNCEGEEFEFKTPSSARLGDSTTTTFPLQKHSSDLAPNNGIRSQKNWNRTCSNKSRKNNNGSRKSKKEIEIQFECFLEDDENSYENTWLPSLSESPSKMANLPKASTTRRSKSVQSWLTQTLGAVKKGCMNPINQKKFSKTQRRNSSELTRDIDEEGQVLIIFERTNVYECTDEYIFSHSIEDDVPLTLTNNQLWENEAPIQFLIPQDNVQPVYSWDCDNDRHSFFDDHNGTLIGSKPVLVPIV